MKKMNNKGFAISTVLYALLLMGILVIAILMSIMASNRTNTSNLVDKIEDELNRYSRTKAEFVATEEAQTYIVPYGKAGWYKIELWGAQGGSTSTSAGGLGSYTSGIIYLKENEHLYFYVGKTTTTAAGGYNGGGSGKESGGGGATDVRIQGGASDDAESVKRRIMVAAGGGGANASYSGGAGGTLIGNTYAGEVGYATQTVGTNNRLYSHAAGTTLGGGNGGGFIVSTNTNGGGDSGSGYGGEGGASYIAGYAGVKSYAYIRGGANGEQTTNTQFDYYGLKLHFINGLMISGVNEGDGKAKIEMISSNDENNLPVGSITNSKLQNVRYIKDCLNGYYKNDVLQSSDNKWIEIQAINTNGENVAKGKTVTSTATLTNSEYIVDGEIYKARVANAVATATSEDQVCVTVDLGQAYNLNEVAIWHNYNGTINYRSHELLVSSDNSNWSTLKHTSIETSTESQKSERETVAGTHYSAWQVDSTEDVLKNGIYYIFSTLPNSENKVLTSDDAKLLEEEGKNANVSFTNFSGEKLQKWYIEKIGDLESDSYYKIIEIQNAHAMQTSESSASHGQNVNAATTFQGSKQQYWIIKPLKNGTYKIYTKLSGYPSLTINEDSNYNAIISFGNLNFSQRFKFVNAEY